MKVLEEELVIDGQGLRRFVFTPAPPQPVRAVAIHYHGQGDYASRYDEVLELFTRQGVACLATDLPGHGVSGGRRGAVPGFRFIDQITQKSESRGRALCPDGPIGILGHSAGGLMGLREILRRPQAYDFAWISSPLVQPESEQSRLLIWILPVLSRLAPWLTISTGVTPDQCRHDLSDLEEIPETDEPHYFHSRISLGWGQELIATGAAVRRDLVDNPPSFPLLITQGGSDPVCPPENLRRILERAAIPQLRYREFPGALHEPFADRDRAEVFAAIESWLDEVLA